MNDRESQLLDLLRQGPPDETVGEPPGFPVSIRPGIVAPVVARRDGLLNSRPGLRPLLSLSVMLVVGAALAGSLLLPRFATTPLATPRPTPLDSAEVSQWPVALPPEYGGMVGFSAPDGSFYVASTSSIDALDAAGHQRVGWPISLPVDGPVLKFAIASDGSLLVAGFSKLADVDPSGKVRIGWPVTISTSGFDGPFVLSDGRILVVAAPEGGLSLVSLLAPTGAFISGWPRIVQGRLVGQPAVGADGTISFAHAVASNSGPTTSQITVFDEAGVEQKGSPITGWDGVAFSPQGDMVVWSHETSATSTGGLSVRRTRIAILGSDGHPRIGWPRDIVGPASVPAFAADGTVYLSLGSGEIGSTGSVLALDRDGQTKPGFPVSLPGRAMALSSTSQPQEPRMSLPPVVGMDGTVYVAGMSITQSLVAALDQTGASLGGWPYVVPPGQQFADFVAGVPNGPRANPLVGQTGLLFLLLRENGEDTLVALDREGRDAPGWPIAVPHGMLVTAWSALSDGGIEVQCTSITPATVVLRYGSAGQ